MIATAGIEKKGMHELLKTGGTVKKVLLVKNMWIKGDAIQSALEEAFGWTVTAVFRGDQAFELLRGGSYDLVITDVAMIGDHYSGFRLIRAIRYDLDQTVPIIVVSNLVSTEIREAACCLGANEYIALPFRMEKLMDTARVLVVNEEKFDG
jgi:DNA-binding response OmpR family regulator